MAKADTVKEVLAANGQTVSEDLTQKQLDELLTIAERDGAQNLTAFSAKLAEFTPAAQTEPAQAKARSETPATPKVELVEVRVRDDIAAYGGEFTDMDSGRSIGKEAVSVPKTAFIAEKLRTGEIVEAD
ncbi:hypothetical protein WDJ50_18645 (plasmid) [Deinococcus sp. VB142]|uniref:DNA-binding protein n=1 Tax=Deinococcus sp. VB142 TaxID=3112952 RepID=A0AAU6Q8T3_9DEIO